MELPLVLVVDDEPIILTSTATAIDDGGYRTTEAETAAAASAIIDELEHLAALLTDVNLGDGESGWEVARHARRRFANVAVVYMTGDSAANWTVEGVPNSVLVQKPFASAQIVTAISSLINAQEGFSQATDS